jgi:hypothetical protein
MALKNKVSDSLTHKVNKTATADLKDCIIPSHLPLMTPTHAKFWRKNDINMDAV